MQFYFRSIEEQIQRISLDEESPTASLSTNNISQPASIQSIIFNYETTTKPVTHPINVSNEFNIYQQPTSLPTTQPSRTNHTSPASDSEPIYAVVDLKNKYARRAKLQQEEQLERERPKSFHASSGDYEEVLKLF